MNLENKEGFFKLVFKDKIYTITIVFIISILLSLIAFQKIPLEVMPKENAEPFLYLSVRNLNSSLENNEREKALVLEGYLKSLQNVTSISSTVNQGQVSFLINYRPKTDMDFAFIELQELAQSLDSDKIVNGTDLSISKFNPDAVSVIKISLTDKSNKPLSRKALEEVKEKIERINEVAKVEVAGEDFTITRLSLNKEKLDAIDSNANLVFKKLNALQYKENLGYVGNGYGKKTALKGEMNALKLESIEATNLSPKASVPLNILAEKTKINSIEENLSRADGSGVVFIEIFNKENVDLLLMQSKLSDLFQAPELNHLKIEVLFDKTSDLKNAINNVRDELLSSIFITFLVVLFFLRNLKLTSVICISIPVSILFTIGVLFLYGKTLNILTLSGLILSIGLTVDSSIVVAERIEALKLTGESMLQSCILGAKEVYMPLLSSTLTSIIIFLPVAFIDGGDSFSVLLKIFQVPVIISLIISYFVALFFIPLLLILINQLKKVPENKTEAILEKEKTEEGTSFLRGLQKINALKLLVFGIFILVTLATYDYIKDIEETDLENPIEKLYSLRVKFGPEIPPETRKIYFLDVEKVFLNQKKKYNIQTIISDFSKNSLVGYISFYPLSSLESDEEIVDFKKKIESFIDTIELKPGVRLSKEGEYGSFSGNQLSSYKYTVEGNLKYILIDWLSSLKSGLKEISGVVSVLNEHEDKGSDSFILKMDLNKLKAQGINPLMISSAFNGLSQSLRIENVKINNISQSVDVIVKSSEIIKNEEDLKNFKIKFLSQDESINRWITLGDIAQISLEKNLSGYSRENGKAKANLIIYYDPKLNPSARSKIDGFFSEIKLPKGINFPIDDNQEKLNEIKKNSDFVIYLSIFLIYLLLASLFESLLIPLSILVTVPLSFVFGVLGLKILGHDLDPMARLGLLILVGTAVSNSIILIDMIGRLRAIGMAKKDAIILGTAKRIEAVFMSTVASVLGLLPVALGSSKIMGIPYSTLGICIISGLLFSSALTIIILPIFYSFFTKIEEKFLVFRKELY